MVGNILIWQHIFIPHCIHNYTLHSCQNPKILTINNIFFFPLLSFSLFAFKNFMSTKSENINTFFSCFIPIFFLCSFLHCCQPWPIQITSSPFHVSNIVFPYLLISLMNQGNPVHLYFI